MTYFALRQWGLAVPEARPFISELGSWPAPQGTGIYMFLFNGMNIQESLVSSILNITNYDSFFFTSPDKASGWLAKQAFQFEEIEKIMEPITIRL